MYRFGVYHPGNYIVKWRLQLQNPDGTFRNGLRNRLSDRSSHFACTMYHYLISSCQELQTYFQNPHKGEKLESCHSKLLFAFQKINVNHRPDKLNSIFTTFDF